MQTIHARRLVALGSVLAALMFAAATLALGQAGTDKGKAAPATKAKAGAKAGATPTTGKDKQAAAPAKPAAPAAAVKPLSMEDVAKIIRERPNDVAARNEYDAREARGITRATLAFELEEPWLLEMQKTVPLEQLRDTYGALRAFEHPGPTLDAVQQAGPAMLDQLRDMVKANNKDGIAALMHPELVVNQATGATPNSRTPTTVTRLATGSMSIAFEMFDSTRYQKHLVGTFRALPGGWVGAPVYVLPSDGVEKFYFVIFSNVNGKMVIRDLIGDQRIAEGWLIFEKEDAAQKLRDLFRDINQRSEATAKAISTPKLYEDLGQIGGWKRFARGQRLAPEQLKITTSVPLDGKSIRVVAHVEFSVPGSVMAFNVDFERFGNEQKVVRVRHPDGTDIAVDTDLDCAVNQRYQLTQTCEPYKTRYTDDVRFLSINKLKYNAQVAMEDSLIDRLDLYAAELETAFPEDQTRGVAMGLRATSAYMKRDFPRANELAASAIAAGGEIYFPMQHLASGFFQLNPTPLQSMRLGMSKTSIHYYPSYRSNREEITADWARVTKFEIDRGGRGQDPDPYIILEIELPNPQKNNKLEKQDLHLMALGSSCPALGTPVPAGSIIYTQAGTCPGSRKAGGVALPRTAPPTTQTVVPKDWEAALTTIVRVYKEGLTGQATGPGPAKSIR